MQLTMRVLTFYYVGILVIYNKGDFNLQAWQLAYYIWMDIFVLLLFTIALVIGDSEKTKSWKRVIKITACFWALQSVSWEGLATIFGYTKTLRSQQIKGFIAFPFFVSTLIVAFAPNYNERIHPYIVEYWQFIKSEIKSLVCFFRKKIMIILKFARSLLKHMR